MAFWNAPLDVEDQERKATECALEMRVALEELNDVLRNEGSPEINTGVGIIQDRVLSVIWVVVVVSIIVFLAMLLISLLDLNHLVRPMTPIL